MLQYWIPPQGEKGKVVVLGVDEIGTVTVEDLKTGQRTSTPQKAEKAAEAAAEAVEQETARWRESKMLPNPIASNKEEEEEPISTEKLNTSNILVEEKRHNAQRPASPEPGTSEAVHQPPMQSPEA